MVSRLRGNDVRMAPPLWIADQVRNDGLSGNASCVFAMVSRLRGNDVRLAPPLWIADQVRNDGLDGNDDMVLHKVSSRMTVWLAQKLSNKRLIFK